MTPIHNVKPRAKPVPNDALQRKLEDALRPIINELLGKKAEDKRVRVGNRYIAPRGDRTALALPADETPVTNSRKIERHHGTAGVRINGYLVPAGD